MKTSIFTILIILASAMSVGAETYCQNINRTRSVVNAEPLAQVMNKWLKQRNISYQTTTKEMTNTIKNFCQSNPSATADDATNHLNTIVDALTSVK